MVRNWMPLAHGWKFLRDECSHAWKAEFDDSLWETVSVPHSFNAADTFVPEPGYPDYYRGGTWYRRILPRTPAGARVELTALGVFSVTDVWVNGKHVGKFMGGYTGFCTNLTPYLKRAGENVLALRVTNQHNPDVLPGLDFPDYNLYGGIYREIGLSITAPLHIPDRGIVLTTPRVSRESAAIHLNVRVANDQKRSASGTVVVDVKSPGGRVVARGRQHYVVAAHTERLVTIPLPQISQPKLWSPDNPTLYLVHVKLLEGEEVVDAQSLRFGFRWFRFDADKGFFLNGRHLKLHGVNRHQDFAGLGNALPANFQAHDVKLIKEMGANFVRCSHYPMHPAFLDACDEMGVIVLEEIASWQWIGGSRFTENAIAMMREMIARDRHHPSIILWGLLNEGRSSDLFRTLNATAKQADPWRATIYADNEPEEGLELGTVFVPDVLGLNYKVPHLDELRAILKGIKLSNTEHTNANTGERRKADGTLFSDEESQIWQIERILHDIAEFEKREWIAGNALWCMHDYGTEYAVSRPIQKSGVFDAWRIPKAAAYAIRAWWSKEPFVRIAEHWTYPGTEGSPRKVIVLSNCESVELLVNGRSFGSRTRDPHAYWFEWEVPYSPGEIVAVGHTPSGDLQDLRRTAGTPSAIAIETLDRSLPANGTDITLVTVTVVDAHGTPVPSAEAEVRFSVSGGGTFFGLYGNTSVSTRSGVGRIAYRSARKKGTVRITASADGLAPASVELKLI